MKNFQLALAALTLVCLSKNQLTALPDYRINGVTGSSSITPVSQTKDYIVTIQNFGSAASANSALRCYVSDNNTWDASDLALTGWVQVGALGANASVVKTMSITLPITVKPGAKFLIFRCDDFNAITESNEANNTKAKAITVGIYLKCTPANHAKPHTGGIVSFSVNTNKSSTGTMTITTQYNSGGTGWLGSITWLWVNGVQYYNRPVAANPYNYTRNATIKFNVVEAGMSVWFYVNIDQFAAPALTNPETDDRSEEADTKPVFEVSVFPNPTTDLLNIELPENAQPVDIQLFDASGRTVRSIGQTTETRLQMPVADLPNGIYFLKMKVGETMATKKILKN